MSRWLLVLCLSAPAVAEHDAAGPVTEYSAYTLKKGEFSVGPSLFEYGALESLDVSTHPALLLARVANFGLKWGFYETGDWSFSAALNVASVNLRTYREDLPDVQVTSLPFEFMTTWRRGDFSYNLGVAHTLLRSNAQPGEEIDLLGLAEISAAFLHPTVEWRLSETFALVLESNIKLFQTFGVQGSTETEAQDGRIRLELFGSLDAEAGEGRMADISLSGYWSWRYFNLRLGLGYGNYLVPVVKLFVPTKIPFPELAIFWRF